MAGVVPNGSWPPEKQKAAPSFRARPLVRLSVIALRALGVLRMRPCVSVQPGTVISLSTLNWLPAKDRIFNAVSQAWCLLGGGVIGRVRAGSGSIYLADRGGVAGLMGECGQYPVPRQECACARCSDRQEQEGRRVSAHALIELKLGRGSLRSASSVPSRGSNSSSRWGGPRSEAIGWRCGVGERFEDNGMVPTFKIHSSKMHWMWLGWVSRSPEAPRAAGSP
jgi:hypothetical protein